MSLDNRSKNSESVEPASLFNQAVCPFCLRTFRCRGRHLPYCKDRNGRDYKSLLRSRKASLDQIQYGGNASPRDESCLSGQSVSLPQRKAGDFVRKKLPCSFCGKFYVRPDVHVRFCKDAKSSLLLLLVHCKVLLIRQMLACLKTSLINSIVFCQHLLKSPHYTCNQHVGNRDSSDHVSGVCGKLRINLPTKSDLWKTLDDFFKATLVPFVLETSDVNNKFSALVDGIHQACSACFGTVRQYNYSQRRQRRNRSNNTAMTNLRQQKKVSKSIPNCPKIRPGF